jgi:hypothetical protein
LLYNQEGEDLPGKPRKVLETGVADMTKSKTEDCCQEQGILLRLRHMCKGTGDVILKLL